MTYDEKQLGAMLTLCTVCLTMKLMTAPQAVCIRCRADKQRADSAEILSSGSGTETTSAPISSE